MTEGIIENTLCFEHSTNVLKYTSKN